LKNFIPAIIWAMIILFLSASSGVKIPDALSDFKGTDKLGHLVIYAVLSVLTLAGASKSPRISLTKSNELLIVGVCSVYGFLMEILQFACFPGRYFEVFDIIANIIGSFTGLLVFKFFITKKS